MKVIKFMNELNNMLIAIGPWPVLSFGFLAGLWFHIFMEFLVSTIRRVGRREIE